MILEKLCILVKNNKIFFENEKGQGLVEYVFIITLIAIVCVTALTGIGNNMAVKFNNILTVLGG